MVPHESVDRNRWSADKAGAAILDRVIVRTVEPLSDMVVRCGYAVGQRQGGPDDEWARSGPWSRRLACFHGEMATDFEGTQLYGMRRNSVGTRSICWSTSDRRCILQTLKIKAADKRFRMK